MTDQPATPYIKLAALYAWLQAEGFKEHTIKSWVEDKTIPRTLFPGRKHAYYHVPAVALALKITNPLANSTQTQQHQPC